jgi:hypothetical protein
MTFEEAPDCSKGGANPTSRIEAAAFVDHAMDNMARYAAPFASLARVSS